LKNASCFMDSLSISYSIGFEVSNEFNMSWIGEAGQWAGTR
jgi:hypothetical protein